MGATSVVAFYSSTFDQSNNALHGVHLDEPTVRACNQRVANIRGTGTGPRSNGNVFLIASGPAKTVFDDRAADFIKGGKGREWFIANRIGGVLDRIVGIKVHDFFDEIN